MRVGGGFSGQASHPLPRQRSNSGLLYSRSPSRADQYSITADGSSRTKQPQPLLSTPYERLGIRAQGGTANDKNVTPYHPLCLISHTRSLFHTYIYNPRVKHYINSSPLLKVRPQQSYKLFITIIIIIPIANNSY